MSDSTEILLHQIDEERSQARQSEDQRATLSGLIVIIASAIQGGLTQTGFQKNALPLTIMLVILGLLGMTASTKLYERHQFHIHRGRKILDRLEELHPDTKIRLTLNAANKEHYQKNPIIADRIRLHYIWLGLHCLITLLGIIYTIVILIR